ncbi:AvrD family protein [Nocardiopsis alba]|uniref:AvrD family protein n=1 Tax=Nocardiopsis alba TaxID=53437 RepID=UPI00366D7E61
MSRNMSFGSVDEYLGPSKGRFFGSGYRRSVYSFDDPSLTEEGLRATVDIDYPADWSRKREGDDLVPHLSTVDVMILGTRCAETLMERRLGSSDREIRDARIRKMVVRAGAAPQEDLVAVPITAAVTGTRPTEDGERLLSTFETRVGAMMTRVQVEHRAPLGEPPSSADWSALLGRPDGYWGTGYREEDQTLKNVHVDLEGLRCRADVEVDAVDHTSGIGSHRPSGPTVVDGFVSLLQLAQILLYELDGLDRSSSDTLWMQQVVLRQSGSTSEDPSSGIASLAISDHRSLDMPDGRWRDASLKGGLDDITMSASFAHRISKPKKEEAA